MLRSCPKDGNLIGFIYRENRILAKENRRFSRDLRVIYRYARPDQCVKGSLVGWDINTGLVHVTLDNGVLLKRKPESFDLVDVSGKMADWIIEFYR